MRIVLRDPTIPGVNEEKKGLPTSYALEQSYPNPFNPRTVVSSQLPVASDVTLVVYDVLGREVAVLVNERRAAGSYQDTFDASGLSSGVYIYRLRAGSFVQSRTMLLLK
jgi:glucuronoarabinoxylan endo-1,4-beta-xylanase